MIAVRLPNPESVRTCGGSEERRSVVKQLITALALAASMASPVLAAAKYHNSAVTRPGVEQLNRDDLYQSYSQGHQFYPNPDRQLYVPQYGD
jgi:hypothetical protein